MIKKLLETLFNNIDIKVYQINEYTNIEIYYKYKLIRTIRLKL